MLGQSGKHILTFLNWFSMVPALYTNICTCTATLYFLVEFKTLGKEKSQHCSSKLSPIRSEEYFLVVVGGSINGCVWGRNRCSNLKGGNKLKLSFDWERAFIRNSFLKIGRESIRLSIQWETRRLLGGLSASGGIQSLARSTTPALGGSCKAWIPPYKMHGLKNRSSPVLKPPPSSPAVSKKISCAGQCGSQKGLKYHIWWFSLSFSVRMKKGSGENSKKKRGNDQRQHLIKTQWVAKKTALCVLIRLISSSQAWSRLETTAFPVKQWHTHKKHVNEFSKFFCLKWAINHSNVKKGDSNSEKKYFNP